MPITIQQVEAEREQAFELGYVAHKTGCWLRLHEVLDRYEPLMHAPDPAQRQTAYAIVGALHTLHKAGVLRYVIDADEQDA